MFDSGDSLLTEEGIKEESTKLIKYFLASLTMPEDELWVNLSPYEKNRIISDAFGKTEMGRDLLAQDYLLKQLTASMIYPEDDLGKKFWERVYAKAQEQYGTSEIPVNTFNKVWIIPDKALIYENGDRAFIVETHMKVMLEEDYLALEHHTQELEKEKAKIDTRSLMLDASVQNQESTIQHPVSSIQDQNSVSSEIIREVIIPEIEKEVNTGKNFAKLRQIYHSFILAAWYKKNLHQSILSQKYADQRKVVGLETNDTNIKDKIYRQYLKAFEKGVYDFIREDYDEATQELVPRKYFSGGVKVTSSPIETQETQMPEFGENRHLISTNFHDPTNFTDGTSSPAKQEKNVSLRKEGEVQLDKGKGIIDLGKAIGVKRYSDNSLEYDVSLDFNQNVQVLRVRYQRLANFLEDIYSNSVWRPFYKTPFSERNMDENLTVLERLFNDSYRLVNPVADEMQDIISMVAIITDNFDLYFIYNSDDSNICGLCNDISLANTRGYNASYNKVMISGSENELPSFRVSRKPIQFINGPSHIINHVEAEFGEDWALDLTAGQYSKINEKVVIEPLNQYSDRIYELFRKFYDPSTAEYRQLRTDIENVREEFNAYSSRFQDLVKSRIKISQHKDTKNSTKDLPGEGSSPIDAKLSIDEYKKGGIDFNLDYLNIQSQGNRVELPVLNNPQQFQNIEIKGLAPFIFNITPITDIPMILGESESRQEEINLSKAN